jgi:hypothetical protein
MMQTQTVREITHEAIVKLWAVVRDDAIMLHALTNAKSDQGNDVNYASSEGQVVWNSMINAVTHPSPNMEESRNAMEFDGARITKPDVLPDKLWLLLAHSTDTL